MKVKFYTLGCKVNQYETQALMEDFCNHGYQITDKIADLYVINTCTVTARADTKSKDAVVKAKKENPHAKIAVGGCLAQLDSGSLERLGADYIISQDKKESLADIVLGKGTNHKDKWSLSITNFFNHRAFIKIQDGCDNFCSFCRVPHARGRSKSRPKKDVIEEIKRLLPTYREIVLCGINLGLYGRDLNPSSCLEQIIDETLGIESLGRLRLSSLEPNLISDSLLKFFSHPKLCPHLHLPFQSGDNDVLGAMNKKETRQLYEQVVKKARSIKSDIAISCDIMVGFPNEEEKNFSNTVEFIKRIKPMRMHIFSFSPRPDTPLANKKITNQKQAKKRYDILQHLHQEFSKDYEKKFIGKVLFMVAEEKEEGFISGYTENYIKVYLNKDLPLGQIVPVEISEVSNGKVFAVAAV